MQSDSWDENGYSALRAGMVKSPFCSHHHAPVAFLQLSSAVQQGCLPIECGFFLLLIPSYVLVFSLFNL